MKVTKEKKVGRLKAKVVLHPSGLFATPKDLRALEAYCDSFSGPGEKVIAFTVAGMAWNLALKMVKNGAKVAR